MTKTMDKSPTEKLLLAFGQHLLKAAEHQSEKNRPISNLNLESIAHDFSQKQPELIEQAQGPDLSKMFLVSGQVHGDDETSVHIVEGDAPSERFIYELLGFNPDNAEEIPEDSETRVYADETPLLAAIESRLKPLADED